MHDVLVFYATTEGQTRRIAERIASDTRARGLPRLAGADRSVTSPTMGR